MSLFLGTRQSNRGSNGSSASQTEPEEALSLFEDDFAYCLAALHYLNNEREQIAFSADRDAQRIALTAPDDLRHRFGYFPREIIPEHWQFVLTPDIGVIKGEIERSRGDEAPWPKIQYLWALNPVMAWLNDRMLAAFGRHQAPVIRYPQGMEMGETVFVISGLIPNQKSHPLVHAWLGVVFWDGAFHHIETFGALCARLRLGERSIPNRGQPEDTKALQALLPGAVEKARSWMIDRRNAFEGEINVKLNDQLQALERLRERQLLELESQLARSHQVEAFKHSRQVQRKKEIDAIFDDYIQWIEDTMTTEKQPYLQVVSVLLGAE